MLSIKTEGQVIAALRQLSNEAGGNAANDLAQMLEATGCIDLKLIAASMRSTGIANFKPKSEKHPGSDQSMSSDDYARRLVEKMGVPSV